MEKTRLQQWIDNSQCINFIEMTLLSDAQGLGRLDIDLIKEAEIFKTKQKRQIKTRSKYLTLSKLWIFGAYELVRLIDEITTTREDLVSQESRTKIKQVKIELEKIRIPLTKFKVPTRQKPEKKNRLFSQVPDSFIDSSGEVGWRVYTIIDRRQTETYYRRSFGDLLLKLLESISENMRAK